MKNILLIVFFIGTIVMMVVMARTGAPLKTTDTPLGILDLEFAYNTARVNKVIRAWMPASTESFGKIETAKWNTYLDFIFLFFYAGFLSLACKRIAQNIKGPVAKAGGFIAAGALLAGFLDVLENIGMLMALSGSITTGIAFLTTFFSIIKWILAATAVLYALSGLVSLGLNRLKRNRP